MAAKSAPPASGKEGSQVSAGAAPRQTIPPKPKPTTNSSNHWLDSIQDVKVGQPDQPKPKPAFPTPSRERGAQDRPDRSTTGGYQDERDSHNMGGHRSYNDERGPAGRGNYREDNQRGPTNFREGGQRGPGTYNPNHRENDYRSPGSYRGIGYTVPGSIGQRPRQPLDSGYNRAPARPGGPTAPGRERFRPNEGAANKPKPPKKPALPKQVQPPKPKREKIPPPAPFVPTPEQIAKVEERYQELSQPAEFDGIRTQIAQELSIPRKTVKKIVKELRDRIGIPSWWEIQTYKGNEAELESIKAAYEPYLPVPPIGVHKEIAQKLELKTGVVYQAIKKIRQELKLPQYNDPETHSAEKSVDAEKPASTDEPQSTAENSQTPQVTPLQATEQTDETGKAGQAVSSDTAIPIDGQTHLGE
ncbi:MAG TPA: hypothetical protein VFN23_15300 [Ktedonobacteraceae bacterium]|nr:hypothetical protein [Ktedonobacteraceae bacterium]